MKWLVALLKAIVEVFKEKNPVPTPTPPKPSPPIPVPPSPEPTIQTLLSAHNAIRKRYNLPLLVTNNLLMHCAATHAGWMASKRSLSHTGNQGSSPFDRMASLGYKFTHAGENIAQGQVSIDEVMNDWMNSPGHRANILNKQFTEIGYGYSRTGNYWCVNFGRPSMTQMMPEIVDAEMMHEYDDLELTVASMISLPGPLYARSV